MSEWLVGIVLFVVATIYAAGRMVARTRKELDQAKADLNRMGAKIAEGDKAALRRYHNSCMVKIASEDDRETRFKIAGLLKED